MRTRLLLPLLLVPTLWLGLSFPAAAEITVAQVTVDPRALDPLKPEAPTRPIPPKPPVRPVHPTPTRPVHPAPAHPAPARPVHPEPAHTPPPSTGTSGMTIRPLTGGTPQPTVPTAPPPPINLPPPILVPTRPVQPAAPAAVNAAAPGTTLPLPDGLRVTFGDGHADLNPTTEAAIRALVRPGPADDTTSYTITTYAAGTPEDPSTARRLSLSRALTVRSVLIGQGIASVRIYVKALGPASQGFTDGPADRADITTAANPLPAPAKTP